ncbi:endo alpha-1,4 polygalactosaminidase [Polaromonas naphthalenivorans]|nr:endo alpha-1,4 polygalactosaminidase [Polaromonas naphthalenivorans]
MTEVVRDKAMSRNPVHLSEQLDAHSAEHPGKGRVMGPIATRAGPIHLFLNPADSYRGLLHFLRKCMSCKVGALWSSCLLMHGCAMAPPSLPSPSPPSTAFFYGTPVPVLALSKFQRIVVEAENIKNPDGLRVAGADVFAYLSVGEAEGWRASSRALPKHLFMGANMAWQSRIADLTQPGWRDFLIEVRMARLWADGYRGFFLDTLDSYEIVAKSPDARKAQAKALVEIIRAMHQRFPGVKLLFNRGFAVLPEAGPLAVGLVAESLFQSWNPTTKEYESVSEQDRNWLLARLNHAHLRYGLPITVIDYVPPDKPDLAQETARQITALGFASWVATPGLDMISIGVKK